MNPYGFQSWCPPGVRRVIAAGANNFIGLVDEYTVLNFPLVPTKEIASYSSKGLSYRQALRGAALKELEVEEQILQHLGPHPRIAGLVQRSNNGLLLENTSNGSVESYIQRHTNQSTS